MIVKIGDKWVVKSKDGSHQFGEYDTEEAAKKRLAEVEAFKHMNNKLQVNILYTINSASNISEKIIDGDPHYVIKNVVPVVDDIVMNGGLYPGDEIKKSFHGLDGKPAPYDHPKIDGKYVSANMTRAANQFSVGAWIENSSHDGSKALVDLYINKVVAERSDKGKELLSRIDGLKVNSADAEPVQVSTGLLLNREQASGTSKGKKYSWIARNMEWDHLAILPPGIPGAGGPADGVGIFAANGEDIERVVVNLEESAMTDESANKIKWWQRAINRLTGNQLSFTDITEQLRNIIKAEMPVDSWPYIVAVYDNYFGVEIDGTIYMQSYIVRELSAKTSPAMRRIKSPSWCLQVRASNSTRLSVQRLMCASKGSGGRMKKSPRRSGALCLMCKCTCHLVMYLMPSSSVSMQAKSAMPTPLRSHVSMAMMPLTLLMPPLRKRKRRAKIR
jgi:hypothetical protein